MASDWALTNKKVTVLTTYSDEKVNCDFFQISSKVKRIRLSQVCKERNVKGAFKRLLLFRKIVVSEKPDIIVVQDKENKNVGVLSTKRLSAILTK